MMALIVVPSDAKRTKLDWDRAKEKIDCSNSQAASSTLRSVANKPAQSPT